MPPPLLVNLAEADLSQTICTREKIYERLLPHRYEFELLDGVCYFDRPSRCVVAYADIYEDAWWVRGHVPGRPLLPGVLMLEMAAQASAVGSKLLADSSSFIAFGGIDGCKFREAVVPPVRLHLLARALEIRPRRVISDTQGVVNGRLVFEARITGLTLT